ncbi:MAG TPA: kelch repeat-containing protein [Gammaproteobacteria bacterium]
MTTQARTVVNPPHASALALASLAALLQACGGGGSSDPTPVPVGPQITSFTAAGDEHFIGEPVELVAQFTGGTGRIDPGGIDVARGQPVQTGRVAEDTVFTLTVTDGTTTVTRELEIDVRYRERWRTIDMPFAREQHVTVELQDGRILVVGGSDASGGTMPTTNYVFDPDTETFAELGNIIDPRIEHVAVVLQTGDVLVTGGDVQLPATQEAEIIDARTGVAFPTGAPSVHRIAAAAVLLEDGRVLVTGGYAVPPLATAELFDPAAGSFTPTAGNLNYGRAYHSATLLDDGRVLIYGGLTAGATPAPPELFDPQTETFTALQPPESIPRLNHVALRLQDGRVGVFGGENLAAVPLTGNLAFATSPDRFEPLTPLAQRRTLARGALLADGRVLLAGGYVSTIAQADAGTVIVAAAGDASAPGPALGAARVFHTMNRLRTGKLLVIGGRDASQAPLATAELFE